LERLAKKLELEFMWENAMGSDDKKTLIVAGSALELLIEFASNIVQSVSLSFPDSAEIVNKHAEAAGKILFKDLQLREGQSPLTKSLESFGANFERLGILDKLSVNPGLNMFEAVAGIYESLCRLHAWEVQKAREEDPSAAAKGDEYLANLVLCTKSGKPAMNERGRVGMTLEYWKERRFQPPPDAAAAAWVAEHEQTWSIHIGCAPLREIGVTPVRISDKWIGPGVEKMPLPGELHTGGMIIDWLEPESTFVPTPDPTMQADPSLLGPRLPDVAFHATFDPPVHIPDTLWHQIQQLAGGMPDETQLKQPVYFDNLVLPSPSDNTPYVPEPRSLTCTKKTLYAAPGTTKLSLKSHANTLRVYKPAFARTLSEMTFSHPQQLITILPCLRQYVLLARLLERSMTQVPDPSPLLDPEPSPTARTTTTASITTYVDAYHGHTGDTKPLPKTSPEAKEEEETTNIDLALAMTPGVPQLSVVFPFRGNQPAHITLEIQENGRVHVAAQDVLDERNMVAANGRERRVEDIGALLERVEDLGKWVEFMRSRWA
jgi:hypothetical protein